MHARFFIVDRRLGLAHEGCIGLQGELGIDQGRHWVDIDRHKLRAVCRRGFAAGHYDRDGMAVVNDAIARQRIAFSQVRTGLCQIEI